jgi:hypothetical protein
MLYAIVLKRDSMKSSRHIDTVAKSLVKWHRWSAPIIAGRWAQEAMRAESDDIAEYWLAVCERADALLKAERRADGATMN